MLKCLFSCIFQCYYLARQTLEGQIKMHSSRAGIETANNFILVIPVEVWSMTVFLKLEHIPVVQEHYKTIVWCTKMLFRMFCTSVQTQIFSFTFMHLQKQMENPHSTFWYSASSFCSISSSSSSLSPGCIGAEEAWDLMEAEASKIAPPRSTAKCL